MNHTQVMDLSVGNAITIGLVSTVGRFNVADESAIPCTIIRLARDSGDNNHAMDFTDADGNTKTILARTNDSEFWDRASLGVDVVGADAAHTSSDTPAATQAPAGSDAIKTHADADDLTEGDAVVFALVTTAGRHPVTDVNAVQGVVLESKTTNTTRIQYTDLDGATHVIVVGEFDAEFWANCHKVLQAASNVAVADVPVKLSSRALVINDDVTFALIATAGRHPVADINAVVGTVIEVTDDCARIRYYDLDDNGHTIRVSHDHDGEFWDRCSLNNAQMVAEQVDVSDEPVVVESDNALIEIRSGIEARVAVVQEATTAVEVAAAITTDLREHMDDRLATVTDVLADAAVKLAAATAALTETLEQLEK